MSIIDNQNIPPVDIGEGMLYYIIKKLKTYFVLLIFLDFCIVVQNNMHFTHHLLLTFSDFPTSMMILTWNHFDDIPIQWTGKIIKYAGAT